MEILSLDEARSTGARHYFTGKPCVRGHIAQRFTSSCVCLACDRELSKSYREGNKAKELDRHKAYRETNKTKISKASKAYYVTNKTKINAASKTYREANKAVVLEKDKARYVVNKERKLAQQAEYRKSNPDKVTAKLAKYRASKANATPKWADLDAINAVYRQAQLLRDIGLDIHVDHIVPLHGKNVCGLHVHQNLRAILASENLSKSNKHERI